MIDNCLAVFSQSDQQLNQQASRVLAVSGNSGVGVCIESTTGIIIRLSFLLVWYYS